MGLTASLRSVTVFTTPLGLRLLFACTLFVSIALFLLGIFVRLQQFYVVATGLVLAISGGIGRLFFPTLENLDGSCEMAPLIALVGCDGSGKSTLSADLTAELAHDRQVENCYLGLGSGAIGEWIKRLPLVGQTIERRLSKKATQSRTMGKKIPGTVTALVIYGLSFARLRRFRRMLRLRRSGVTVITDRYPQIEVTGFYDGPGLSAARPGNRFVAFLAGRERRIYDWMASFRPDVVIRLNIDTDTAYARKSDHRYDLLAQKVSVTPTLRFNGARIVDLNSCEPYNSVYARAMEVSRALLLSHPHIAT